jgi:hypothetical protein
MGIMKKLAGLMLVCCIAARNDGTDHNGNNADTASERPRPVTEGVTNSTQIVGDSVIVPDTNNTGVNPSDGVDTLGPMQKKKNTNNNNQ